MIDVQVFTRDGLEKDQRALEIEERSTYPKYRKICDDEYRIVEAATFQRLKKALLGSRKWLVVPKLKKGDALSAEYLDELQPDEWFKLRLVDSDEAQ